MAEKAERKSEAAAAAPAEKRDAHEKGGGLMSKTPVLLGGVMLLEAVVLFAGFKFLGGGHPQPAAGAELTSEEHASPEKGEEKEGEHGEKSAKPIDRKKSVIVDVLAFRAPNKVSGKTFLYDLEICALTKGEHKDTVETTIKEKKPLIQDRVRTIIAQSDPEKLGGGSEPGLETLRRQVKYQLDEILGEGMIEEVLVTKCIPFRTDY